MTMLESVEDDIRREASASLAFAVLCLFSNKAARKK